MVVPCNHYREHMFYGQVKEFVRRSYALVLVLQCLGEEPGIGSGESGMGKNGGCMLRAARAWREELYLESTHMKWEIGLRVRKGPGDADGGCQEDQGVRRSVIVRRWPSL